MTTASIQGRVDELFADARQVHAQAVERLEHGDIRDAAEKAWCAAKRATDGLILALTGEEPSTTAATTNYLDSLAPGSQTPDGSRAATTAGSTTSTGCASTPDSATTRPNAASGRPRRTLTTPRPSPADK